MQERTTRLGPSVCSYATPRWIWKSVRKTDVWGPFLQAWGIVLQRRRNILRRVVVRVGGLPEVRFARGHMKAVRLLCLIHAVESSAAGRYLCISCGLFNVDCQEVV